MNEDVEFQFQKMEEDERCRGFRKMNEEVEFGFQKVERDQRC